MLRVIADIHGKYIPYAKIVQKADKEGLCTLQLGDFGFSYGIFKHHNIDPNRHTFIGGNHDNYSILLDKQKCPPHYLGDFGEKTLPGCPTFFFVRGAFSIDKVYRVEGKDLWAEEELSYQQCVDAFDLYNKLKPSLVATHDCPQEVLLSVYPGGNNIARSKTGQLLQAMFDAHKPNVWVFGHHHLDIRTEIKHTQFICRAELSHIDLPLTL